MRPLRRKLLRDIRHHRANFMAVTVTVMLGITLFAASFDSFQNLEASYAATATEFRFANLTIVGGDIASFAAGAAGTPGVDAIQIRTVADLALQAGDVKLLGRVVGLPPASQPDVNRIKVLAGGYLANPARVEVLVEEHMADHFGLTPGSSIRVLGPAGWEQVPVVGIASSPEYIWPARDRQDILTSPDNFGVVFAPESQAQRLAGVTTPNEAAVYYQGGEPDDVLTGQLTDLSRRFGAADTYTRDEQPSNAALEEDLTGFRELSLFFPILFLAAAAMAAYVMINRLVYAQRPHIGVLLAEGFTRRQVLGHYLGYGLVPGLVGAVPGVVGGILLARLITGLYTDLLSVPVKLIRFYPATLALGVGFGLAATLVAAAAPALSASRVVPAAAMRGTVPPGKGRPSLVERVVPPARRLPIRWRMTLRGIERNTRRTVYTMLGVVLSLTLILVSWGMIDTVDYLMNRQYNEIQLEDARAYFTAPVGEAEVASLAARPGVAAAEPALELALALSADDERRYETALSVLDADTGMHRFFTSGGRQTELPSDGVLAGVSLGDLLGVTVGDTVRLWLPDLGATVEDRIAGFVEEPLGTLVYASRSHLESVTGREVPATSALLRYEEGADAGAVRTDLTGLPQIAAFEDSKALYDVMQRYMTLFYAFVGVMLAFGAAMAFALIFNSMSVNIAERSREVATLLAVGTDRASVSRLITAENLLVAAAGIPPGLGLGYYVSALAMASFNSDLFRFDLHVRPTTFLWSSAAILVVALLSQWPGLRAVARLDIARIVKERSA